MIRDRRQCNRYRPGNGGIVTKGNFGEGWIVGFQHRKRPGRRMWPILLMMPLILSTSLDHDRAGKNQHIILAIGHIDAIRVGDGKPPF
jgi:hypothetical protein